MAGSDAVRANPPRCCGRAGSGEPCDGLQVRKVSGKRAKIEAATLK